MPIKSINPYTGKTIKEFDEDTDEEIERCIASGRKAFSEWGKRAVSDRASLAGSCAKFLRQDSKRLSELITMEMGKPIRQSREEIEKCAMMCEFYADNSAQILKDEVTPTELGRSYVMFQPLGMVLGIMPWNFPFWQALRFAIPTLTAGNAVLLKHASNVPICAQEIERIIMRAGYPEGVFKTLLIGAQKAQRIVGERRVDAVSLTGSELAGSKIGEIAGRGIMKTVLELGGSDPFIVLQDADTGLAADALMKARFNNAGQNCNSPKRIIVVGAAADGFIAELKRRFESLRVGDPMLEDTDIGPLAREDVKVDIEGQLRDAQEKGATVIRLGSSIPEGGCFFAPCIVTGVSPDMRIAREEVFGPIAAVIFAKDEEDAIRLANDTEYGLGASVWSKDANRGEAVALRIQAGIVAINRAVRSDPRLPFGGIKKSGIGRELGAYGIKEFVNVKTVIVAK
jgi:succinate-semialdehyde dehydrogenase/glutarate-semialdehyde dehydrogenase